MQFQSLIIIKIFILYSILLNSIQSSNCITKKQLESRLIYENSNFNKDPKIILVYNIVIQKEISNLTSNIDIESICVRESIDNDSLNNENTKEKFCFIYELHNSDNLIKKYKVEASYEAVISKVEALKSNLFQSFIQNSTTLLKSNSISTIKMSKQNKFILSMMIFLFSSVFLFVIFRKTVDWGSSAKAELNRYRELRNKILIEKIDDKFKYIRPIDL